MFVHRPVLPQIRNFAPLPDRMGRAGDYIDVVNASSITEGWLRVSGNQPLSVNGPEAVPCDAPTSRGR